MFQTEFICILTAGNTVDGRKIPQQILDDVAETYDQNIYNARINLVHEQGGWKAGSVLALKVKGNQLLAQLKPNELMLNLISQGQLLHTSCELQPNFAKTGKWYLTGLALTDEPASLGTAELHLSAKRDSELFCSDETIAAEKPTLLNKLFNKQKDTEMTDKATLEMLSQIKEANTSTSTALTQLTGVITELAKTLSAEESEEEQSTSGDVAVTELTEKLSELTAKFETQNQAFTDLKEKLSNQTDEQARDQATGGDAVNLDDVL